ncbi:hypothetical protein EDB81DRAFT_904941 [Dactylonectria macrodidyma]|uniref:Nitrogen regulatory protein areA GATA-like domain-containing protein n=1 Tax=Dactylonectria macrodidyma TaxID=307937 RepID=A0A9P9E5H9_9HYPO|nr:hypothetical protein EDB81DRAFT_904941 [Dactylonectria macrodidyma]
MWIDSVEQGRRLENLSWRLWQRETFVADNDCKAASTNNSPKDLPQNIPSDFGIPDLPQLSGSVESLTNEEAADITSASVPLEICRPGIRRQDSYTSSRSKRERHISSDDFERMMVFIAKDKGPLSAPSQISPMVDPVEESLPSSPAFGRSGSTTTETQSPTKSISDRSDTSLELAPMTASRTIVVRGFSPSSRPSSLLSLRKKQASPNASVITRTIEDEAAVDSDTDYIDESAIDDDDDSSDWEDSIEDSGKSSMDDKFFQRVDSKANLTSRRSLITLMLAQNDRARTLGNHASQSTSTIPRSRMASNSPSLGASPNDSDEAPLMMKGTRPLTLKPIHEITRSSSQPIVSHAGHVQGQAALSPRTTRRTMLATELTESLRRHLLWERQQKSSTANAAPKRLHTSHDVANLKQYPVKSCIKTSEDADASSWNQYFSKETSNGYHSKGW